MTARTGAAIEEQRDELVEKVDLEVDRKVNLGNRLLQHHRMILQDLPFDGTPELITDEHRDAIERLIEKHGKRNLTIRLKRVVGYASKIGDDADNMLLSNQRAEAVRQFLVDKVNEAGIPNDEIFIPNFRVVPKGESDLPYPTNPAQDNPLNRRVEIVYTLSIALPPPPDAAGGPTSTLWKIDFGPAGSGFFMQAGSGTLTMLPDGESGSPASPINKSFKFEQLGASVGIFDKLKKAKFMERWPALRQYIALLDPDKGGNYYKTTQVLQNVGFSFDVATEGGQFQTDLRVSFNDLQSFKFMTLSGGLSLLAGGQAALYMLYNDWFFSPTAIAGAGLNIAVPDVSVSIVPLGFVQVDLES